MQHVLQCIMPCQSKVCACFGHPWLLCMHPDCMMQFKWLVAAGEGHLEQAGPDPPPMAAGMLPRSHLAQMNKEN